MIELLENVDLEGFVVIIPSISVGNVGQLASDLLIYSLNLKKLGYVRHPCALPLAGADPFNWSNAPSLGCELYYSSSLKLIVFQIRTAITRSDSFTQDLCTWLKSVKVKQVVILAGSSAHERRDKQLIQEPLRYVFCPLTGAKETENAKRRNWIELENKDVANLSSKKSLSYIPGSGLAVKLFNKCVIKEIPCSILLDFCSDGDNIPDALKLVNYLNDWFQLKEKQNTKNWSIPPSWNFLFGYHPPTEIFN